jgi:GTP pyrophosphokinase
MEVARQLVEKMKLYDSNVDGALVMKAAEFAKKYHGTQLRASGDPYYFHPIQVAHILADLKLDSRTVITAILHDTVEDTEATVELIAAEFGEDIAKLVDGVTKLTKLEYSSEQTKHAENFRKLLLAISEDIRVLLVKLADRLHNMRTLHFIPKLEKRQRIALETMEIYAALAERIGIQKIKDELQDLAFKELHPDGYQSVTSRLEFLRENAGSMVETTVVEMKRIFAAEGLDAEITGREKKPYSIWRKMENKNVSFEQLTDIVAFRVIVNTVADCYHALGIVHSHYHMVPDSFKDFISTPKENGYRSLHTLVIGPEQRRIEIQIRTREMHDIAEMGVAAHWSYKQHRDYGTDGKQFRWIREMLFIIDNAAGPEEFMENSRLEMYHDQVFCFTPKGTLIALPNGSTTVDFAYAVHTNVGNTCVGAKVNGRIVPLKTKLQNGDQVEIIRSKTQMPSAAWESFVITGRAKSAIRRFIRQREREEYIRLGKTILLKGFETEGLVLDDKLLEANAEKLNRKTAEDIYAHVGEGVITKADVIRAIYPDHHERKDSLMSRFNILDRFKGKKPEEDHQKSTSKIPIKGLIPGMAVHFAGCCHPLPGDQIIGVINSGKGVTIHTEDCDELAALANTPERFISVAWETGEDEEGKTYIGRLKAVLSHEAGSLGTLANTIAKDHGNINNFKITSRSPDFFEVLVDVEVKDIRHLSTLMASLRSKSCIYSVERYN